MICSRRSDMDTVNATRPSIGQQSSAAASESELQRMQQSADRCTRAIERWSVAHSEINRESLKGMPNFRQLAEIKLDFFTGYFIQIYPLFAQSWPTRGTTISSSSSMPHMWKEAQRGTGKVQEWHCHNPPRSYSNATAFILLWSRLI